MDSSGVTPPTLEAPSALPLDGATLADRQRRLGGIRLVGELGAPGIYWNILER